MTFPVGTRIREIATGDLGTVCEPGKELYGMQPPADAVWAKWDKFGEHVFGDDLWLPASEVEAVTE